MRNSVSVNLEFGSRIERCVADYCALQIQSLRAYAAPHHPERGAVTVDELASMGANQPQLPLDRHLSIFVTDVETVSQIKFSEAMDQLVQVKQSGDPFLSKTIHFHQWWDRRFLTVANTALYLPE